MRFILVFVLLLSTIAPTSRAASLDYEVFADLSNLSGGGFLGFSLSSLGAPLNNVTATVSGLTFNGGVYDFGSGGPVVDVFRLGNTITMGGTSLSRVYDMPVTTFGSSLSFRITLDGPGVLGLDPGDGWSFAFFAADSPAGNLEYLLVDIPQTGQPDLTYSQNVAINLPEPASFGLVAFALSALAYARRRASKSS